MLKKIFSILLGLTALFLLGGFVLPSQVHVERSLFIPAPAAVIFSEISDLNRWDAWSPWAAMDPDMALTVTGQGVGQTMTWHSDDPMVGDGQQTITALTDAQQLATHLDFGKQGMADATFTLMPQSGGTQVVWALDTDMREGVPLLDQPFSTYFGLVMDRLVGADYEQGLQNLAAVVAQPA